MSIVIDANVLSDVFSANPSPDAIPVREWIENGSGRVVVGGTKYMKEMGRISSAVRCIRELARVNKVVTANAADVDRLESAVVEIVPSACNDPHLIALIGVTRCPLIFSKDIHAHEFISDKTNYPWPNFSPKIYTGKKHAKSLLTEENARAKCFCDAAHNSRFNSFISRCKGESER